MEQAYVTGGWVLARREQAVEDGFGDVDVFERLLLLVCFCLRWFLLKKLFLFVGLLYGFMVFDISSRSN